MDLISIARLFFQKVCCCNPHYWLLHCSQFLMREGVKMINGGSLLWLAFHGIAIVLHFDTHTPDNWVVVNTGN